MKKLILSSLLVLALPAVVTADNLHTKMSPDTGNTVSVWDDFTGSVFDIFASIQTSGTWSAPANIGNPVTDPQQPVADINAADQAIAVWRGYDPLTFSQTLYGSFYFGGVWTSTGQLSDPTTENLLGEYSIHLADDGRSVATWTSYNILTGGYEERAIYSATFGTWGTPVTIN